MTGASERSTFLDSVPNKIQWLLFLSICLTLGFLLRDCDFSLTNSRAGVMGVRKVIFTTFDTNDSKITTYSIPPPCGLFFSLVQQIFIDGLQCIRHCFRVLGRGMHKTSKLLTSVFIPAMEIEDKHNKLQDAMY